MANNLDWIVEQIESSSHYRCWWVIKLHAIYYGLYSNYLYLNYRYKMTNEPAKRPKNPDFGLPPDYFEENIISYMVNIA